jgi:response regulator RpfG family c-di-GMP phosphodiesterase
MIWGKIGIPDNILLKPGSLTREEVRVMRPTVSGEK